MNKQPEEDNKSSAEAEEGNASLNDESEAEGVEPQRAASEEDAGTDTEDTDNYTEDASSDTDDSDETFRRKAITTLNELDAILDLTFSRSYETSYKTKALDEDGASVPGSSDDNAKSSNGTETKDKSAQTATVNEEPKKPGTADVGVQVNLISENEMKAVSETKLKGSEASNEAGASYYEADTTVKYGGRPAKPPRTFTTYAVVENSQFYDNSDSDYAEDIGTQQRRPREKFANIARTRRDTSRDDEIQVLGEASSSSDQIGEVLGAGLAVAATVGLSVATGGNLSPDSLEQAAFFHAAHRRLHRIPPNYDYMAEKPRCVVGTLMRIMAYHLGSECYKRKGLVLETDDCRLVKLRVIFTGDELYVDKDWLSTVIPIPGKRVMILKGHFRGCPGVLKYFTLRHGKAIIEISEESTGIFHLREVKFSAFTQIYDDDLPILPGVEEELRDNTYKNWG